MSIFGRAQHRASVLSISDHAVRFFELIVFSDGEIKNISWAEKTFSPGTVVEGVVEREDAFRETMRLFRKHHRVSRAHLVLPSSVGLIARLPHSGERVFEGDDPSRSVRALLEQAFKGTNTSLDSCEILDLYHKGPILYADLIPKTIIRRYEDLLGRVGIKITSCEIERVDGIVQAGDHTRLTLGIHETGSSMAISAGSLSVLRGGISFQGKNLVKDFSRILGTSENEAEKIIRAFGFLRKHHHSDTAQELSYLIDPLAHALGDVMESWKNLPYPAAHERGDISEIVVYGDYAQVPGLTDLLSARMKVPVRALETWDISPLSSQDLGMMSRDQILSYAPLAVAAFRDLEQFLTR